MTAILAFLAVCLGVAFIMLAAWIGFLMFVGFLDQRRERRERRLP